MSKEPTLSQMTAWANIKDAQKGSESNRNQASLFRRRLTTCLDEAGISINLINPRSSVERAKEAAVRHYVDRNLTALPDLIDVLKRLESRSVHIVTAHTICEISLFRHLQDMQDDGVVSNFSLATAGTAVALRDLELGRSDISFFNRRSVDEKRMKTKGFKVGPYGDFPFGLVVPNGDDLLSVYGNVRSEADVVALLKNLFRETHLVLSPPATKSRAYVEAKLNQYEIEVDASKVISLDSTTAMLDAVHRGFGYGIMWRPEVESEEHFDVARISLEAVLGRWEVGFAYSVKGATKVVKELARRLRQDYENLS